MAHRKDDVEQLIRSSVQSIDSVGVNSTGGGQDDVSTVSLSIASLADSTTNLYDTRPHKIAKKHKSAYSHSSGKGFSLDDHLGDRSTQEEDSDENDCQNGKKNDKTFFVGVGILFSIFAITSAFLLIILPCYRMFNLNALLHSNHSTVRQYQEHLVSSSVSRTGPPSVVVKYQEMVQNAGVNHKSLLYHPKHRQQHTEKASAVCDVHHNENRYDCYPDYYDANERNCLSRGCCWRPSVDRFVHQADTNYKIGVPFCFLPSNYAGYGVIQVDESRTGATMDLLKASPSAIWPKEFRNLKVVITYETPQRLHFKIYDPAIPRYEVPIDVHKPAKPTDIDDCDYIVYYVNKPFGLVIRRKSTKKVIFNSAAAAPLIFADQYLQIGTLLSSKHIYGLGEHRDSFLINVDWTSRGYWARDQPPSRNTNLYGVHPFYLNMEDDNNAHGVLLLNSNAMQIDFQPEPSLTYRTIGGILDFYVFLGPTPNSVVQQYTELIGRPFMPPYWSLGFHLCRWGYNDSATMKKVIKRNRDAKIPYDVQWNDIDAMDKKRDWTYDPKLFADLPQIVDDLHDHGQHYIMIVDGAISSQQPKGTYPPYDDGLKDGVFVVNQENGKPLVGRVWPGDTVFPDFLHPKAFPYWYKQGENFYKDIKYDGIWADMNEPSNFVAGSEGGCLYNNLNYPPFKSPAILGSKIYDKTICPSAAHNYSSHYNLHNLYGYSQTKVSDMVLRKLRNKRSLVISRSTFVGSGVHGGHWSGDNFATWDDLYYSIPEMLNFQLFGIPMVGADICGFIDVPTTELCIRWMQLGAFYPFMRNHNGLNYADQDPASFDSRVQDSMRKVLNTRYSLLPYLYTLLHKSHVDGSAVVWPLFFIEPNQETYKIDQQFLWGTDLMISPVLKPKTFNTKAYFPKGLWYDFYTGATISSAGLYTFLDAPLDKINLHVRGGAIIPTIQPDVTTTASRKKKFGLFVAYDDNSTSRGELFWDDGESLDTYKTGNYTHLVFTATQYNITSEVMASGYAPTTELYLGSAIICGVSNQPHNVLANSKPAKFIWSASSQVMRIESMALSLTHPIAITWS
ncbi:lysosomal alpha-glucosidase-like [Argonauta hians]